MAQHSWETCDPDQHQGLGWFCISCGARAVRPVANEACGPLRLPIAQAFRELEEERTKSAALRQRCEQLETLCTDLRTRLIKAERELKYGARP